MFKLVGRRIGSARDDAGNRHHGDLEPSLAVSSSSRSNIVRGLFSIYPGGKYSKRRKCSSSPKILTHNSKAPSPSLLSWRDGGICFCEQMDCLLSIFELKTLFRKSIATSCAQFIILAFVWLDTELEFTCGLNTIRQLSQITREPLSE